jgi:signal transduction histidine kinase
MLRALSQGVPRTIRGQITVVVVLALITVITLGGALERWAKNDYSAIDMESMRERMDAVALLMAPASHDERLAMLANADKAGWKLSLEPMSTVDRFHQSSPQQSTLSRIGEWLFPPDDPAPFGGWRTFLDDSRVIAVRIDDETMLLLSDFPDAILTSSMLSQGSYYFVAIVVLLAFFFVFAIRVITEPIRRISSAATDSDITNGSAIFEERGTVEIVALARALNGMRNRIRIMMDTRTRMLRGIGHDLRTPLTRLRLRTERMGEGQVRDALLTDIDRIDGLLAESLNYLRDDYANEKVERVDVASILQTICSDFSDVGFAVSYRGPNRFIANCRASSITRAVVNLCDNAVKFAKSVEVEISEHRGGFAVTVSDDGPGIPESLRERVFEPFFKIDAARTNGKAGFGLGLSIVSDIAHSHRGTIELLPRLPIGLTARLVIPALPI